MQKNIFKILLTMSLIPHAVLIFGIINSSINGFGSNPDVVSSFLLPKKYGMNGIKMYLYYMFNPKLLGTIFIPLYGMCFIYQIMYFTKIRKKLIK